MIFEPFAAVRPRGALKDLLCPPYDAIPAPLAKRLRRSKKNAIHVELPLTSYPEARRLWEARRDRGELVRDPAPAFYICEQSYDRGGPKRRLGVFGALQVTPPAGRVLPHERTLPKHRKDRMRHLGALGVNTSPIFGAYSDPALTLQRILRRLGRPAVSGRDAMGYGYRLWKVERPADVQALGRSIAASKILIADGHHRFRVAREYHLRTRRPGSERILAYLAPEEQPGLLVLPTHRLVSAGEAPLAKVAALCRVAERPSLEALLKGVEGLAFGLVLRTAAGPAYLLCRPRPQALKVGGKRPALDVEWVQGRLLRGLDPHDITYLHDAREVDERVRSKKGPALAGLLLGPLAVPRIRQAVERNGLLPQKSTYFYPKIATGLVFRPLSPSASSY